MIKLSQQAQDELVKLAFIDELEKQAWGAILARAIPLLAKILPKGLRAVGAAAKNKGAKAALKGTNLGKWGKGGVEAIKKGKGTKYFSQFAGPGNQLTKSTLKSGKISLKNIQRVGGQGGTLSRGIRTSVGNMAQNLSSLGKGVKGQGLLKGTKQVGKNLYTTSKRQLRASQYKEVALKPGQSVLKGKGLFGKSKFFNRKVVATTNRGTGLVKKRGLVRPMSAAFTAPGMAATGMMAGGGSTDQSTNVGQQSKRSISKRVGSGLKEGLPWLVGAPVGTASLL